ncbi:acetate--CoA ligase [Rhodohalobacter sulfatireducens]|uniref:Acetate--CoA ligase n=1 Tax=Rhodohalobacter sulfatireducens TaxID=2911366 RepID=A0ABS9K9B0_9BACT|nr:acetate--CoA ligase [Rhodohalobacter sulfatireducens]MCG2587440.1 acetate--CoA ligase [Rhodohalobacter sulfatireducens]MDR9366890.1 acetate--CoA ligase [Balneolaceae bacterium]MDR9410214.1 acetate--CoA ligase [Balneolaceae bacterium]
MWLNIKSFEEYKDVYRQSEEDRKKFWEHEAGTFYWRESWDKVHSGGFENGDIKWFEGGKLNITENALDRHLNTIGHKTAFIFEPNHPDSFRRTITYRQLYEDVCRFANVLESKGVEKGDRVCIYMAMTPELIISALACARIGAVHSIVFAGFSAQSLAERIQDCDAKMLITNDGLRRGDKHVPLKDISDEALEECPTVKNVIVCQRTNRDIDWVEGRDEWWHMLIRNASKKHTAVEMDAEDPLFILYTSGSTGKPKGVLHTCGGYMVYTSYTFRNVFQVSEEDIYWCTADAGWITGHSYIIYGPLFNGATGIIFEGVPTYPDAGRFWEVVEKYEVTHFYTAPTAIRALMSYDLDFVKKYDLSSLKVLGSVGEPINEEAWHWYHDHVGGGKCPIVDTWWQTETGGIMISPLAGITPTKPGFATLPLPGITPVLMDENGKEIGGNGVSGNLCIKHPWPGIARTVWGDHERYLQTYMSSYKGYYFTGDGCRRDEEGYYRITGRVDDVLNVSGHRLGTAEIENAIDEHPNVVETAIVGYPHDIKGESIFAFIICEDQPKNKEDFKKEIHKLVTKIIGPIAKPEKIQIVAGLPKTRSGKIMRRVLRKIAANDLENLGDTSTLLDPSVVDEIKEGEAF